MTPKQFVAFREQIKASIYTLERQISEAGEQSVNSPMPDAIHLKPATPGAICMGTIVWHVGDESTGGSYWNIVKDLNYQFDRYSVRSYIAEDGGQYGLHDAFLEKDILDD